jgi:hypothetical protein
MTALKLNNFTIEDEIVNCNPSDVCTDFRVKDFLALLRVHVYLIVFNTSESRTCSQINATIMYSLVGVELPHAIGTEVFEDNVTPFMDMYCTLDLHNSKVID